MMGSLSLCSGRASLRQSAPASRPHVAGITDSQLLDRSSCHPDQAKGGVSGAESQDPTELTLTVMTKPLLVPCMREHVCGGWRTCSPRI